MKCFYSEDRATSPTATIWISLLEPTHEWIHGVGFKLAKQNMQTWTQQNGDSLLHVSGIEERQRTTSYRQTLRAFSRKWIKKRNLSSTSWNGNSKGKKSCGDKRWKFMHWSDGDSWDPITSLRLDVLASAFIVQVLTSDPLSIRAVADQSSDIMNPKPVNWKVKGEFKRIVVGLAATHDPSSWWRVSQITLVKGAKSPNRAWIETPSKPNYVSRRAY